MTFTGFSAEGLSFLTELGRSDKAFFDAHRPTYQTEVADPAKEFVVAMGEALAESISPDIVAVPKTNGSISPINNDVRFAKDAPPYKDHLLFRFWEGPDKKVAPTLFVRVNEDSIGFATGSPIASVERWRELVYDERAGGALAAAIDKLGKGRALDIGGQSYKRVPKPYDEDHPRADLLKHKMGFQARWPEPPPASIHKAAFVGWCARRLEATAEIHRWFLQHRP